MTTWQQINHWLKIISHTINFPTNDYVFIEKEQKIIVDDNQSLSSITLATFDGIKRDDTIKVIVSFESHTQNICVLKSTSIHCLLNNEYLLQQLHLNISLDKCVFVLEESNTELLTENDIQKSLGNFSYNYNQPIHFRISILIEILIYDNKQQLKIPISNRNTTIEQILQITKMPINIYKYLASNLTKKIISNDEYISKLNETKFILIKENEICKILIKTSSSINIINENIQYQQYSIFATISNIYDENKFDIKHQYFLYSNDFIPSIDIPLTSFQITSPIEFTLIDYNLPLTITIINKENQESMKFNCSSSLTMKRIYQIVCQLFNINSNYYKLMYNDCIIDDDDDILLDEIDSNVTNIQFHLISIATRKCSIKYLDQTIVLPCHNKTSILIIIQETFKKLYISQDDINMYELYLIDNGQIQTDFDTIIEDILQLFSSDIMIIPFELKKKDEK